MSPCDFLKMYKGYTWRQERKDQKRLTDLYLWRMIASFTHNALADSRAKAKSPKDILSIPALDKGATTEESIDQQKQRLREALEKANGSNNRRSEN